MIVFYSDLDNTLIYSYRHDIGEKKRCVELYQGREISFITDKTYELLQKVKAFVLFIPITTRTIEQYGRIELGIGTPEYALACNGGILLENGTENNAWYEESLDLIKDAQEEMKRAQEWLYTDKKRNFELRYIRNLFLFTKSEQPPESVERLRAYLDADKVDVFSNGTKVYAVPKQLNKGVAIKRLNKKLCETKSIGLTAAAGDSVFDLPMIEAADIMLAPNDLEIPPTYRYIQRSVKMDGKHVFAEDILEYVLNLQNE